MINLNQGCEMQENSEASEQKELVEKNIKELLVTHVNTIKVS